MSKKRTTAKADSANATLGTNESSSSSISKTPETKPKALAQLAGVLTEQIDLTTPSTDDDCPSMDVTGCIRDAVLNLERFYPNQKLPVAGRRLWNALYQTTRPRSSSSSSSLRDTIADEMDERCKRAYVFLAWVKKEPTTGKSGKRGRPPDTDPKKDKKIYDAWKTGSYMTYAELANALGIEERDVSLAIDRQRKR